MGDDDFRSFQRRQPNHGRQLLENTFRVVNANSSTGATTSGLNSNHNVSSNNFDQIRISSRRNTTNNATDFIVQNRNLPPAAENVREVIRLANPRPTILRSENEYVAVNGGGDVSRHRTSQSRTLPSSHGRSSSARARVHRRPVTASVDHAHTGTVLLTHNNNNNNEDFVVAMETPIGRRGNRGGQLGDFHVQSSDAFYEEFCGKLVRDRAAKSATIISQPKKKSRDFVTTVTDGRAAPPAANGNVTIICKECNKCRCRACRQPKALPSRDLCNHRFLCSADNVVDTLTCMKCVKGCWYHVDKCRDDCVSDDGGSLDDYDDDRDVLSRCLATDASSCCAKNRATKNVCLCVACALLPCLWCYLPLKACSWLCAKGYARYHDNGCRCQRHVDDRDRRRLQRRHSDSDDILRGKQWNSSNNVPPPNSLRNNRQGARQQQLELYKLNHHPP